MKGKTVLEETISKPISLLPRRQRSPGNLPTNGGEKIWQQPVSLVPNIEQRWSIARCGFSLPKVVACAQRYTREILFLFRRQDIANVFLKFANMYSWVHARRTFLFEKTREHEGYILFETFGI